MYVKVVRIDWKAISLTENINKMNDNINNLFADCRWQENLELTNFISFYYHCFFIS